MTRGQLVTLAVGADEARRVDFSIPQATFDGMTGGEREDVAGWYYDASAPTFGRLLTQSECWALIRTRVEHGELLVVDPVEYAAAAADLFTAHRPSPLESSPDAAAEWSVDARMSEREREP